MFKSRELSISCKRGRTPKGKFKEKNVLELEKRWSYQRGNTKKEAEDNKSTI